MNIEQTIDVTASKYALHVFARRFILCWKQAMFLFCASLIEYCFESANKVIVLLVISYNTTHFSFATCIVSFVYFFWNFHILASAAFFFKFSHILIFDFFKLISTFLYLFYSPLSQVSPEHIILDLKPIYKLWIITQSLYIFIYQYVLW